ncbi:hypothetical protein SAMN04487818_107312 [Actinokineospora terrae]|uniref:Uncharacterized protein n=1 Tax=Actinokineospora terrae TaxID=155974 RepID=A0A1H9ULH7_9PSEU|nr:hypothetical protein SAMN04487818_107312 [Actinokineospora terrae]
MPRPAAPHQAAATRCRPRPTSLVSPREAQPRSTARPPRLRQRRARPRSAAPRRRSPAPKQRRDARTSPRAPPLPTARRRPRSVRRPAAPYRAVPLATLTLNSPAAPLPRAARRAATRRAALLTLTVRPRAARQSCPTPQRRPGALHRPAGGSAAGRTATHPAARCGPGRRTPAVAHPGARSRPAQPNSAATRHPGPTPKPRATRNGGRAASSGWRCLPPARWGPAPHAPGYRPPAERGPVPRSVSGRPTAARRLRLLAMTGDRWVRSARRARSRSYEPPWPS